MPVAAGPGGRSGTRGIVSGPAKVAAGNSRGSPRRETGMPRGYLRLAMRRGEAGTSPPGCDGGILVDSRGCSRGKCWPRWRVAERTKLSDSFFPAGIMAKITRCWFSEISDRGKLESVFVCVSGDRNCSV